jgi:hypothetical protein
MLITCFLTTCLLCNGSDPNSVVEFSDILYNNTMFIEAISRSLGPDGIFIAQTGEVDYMDDPPDELDPTENFSFFLEGLLRVGFESVLDYEESHGRFQATWSFVLALKDSELRSRWLSSEAEIQYEMKQRLLRTKDGESPLRYFDGATMMQYHFPSRSVEESWCTSNKKGDCRKGHGFDPEIQSLPRSAFEVKASAIAGGGRGVFAKEFIPKGSYIGLDDCVQGMFVPSLAHTLVSDAADSFANFSEYWNVFFWGYIEGYVSVVFVLSCNVFVQVFTDTSILIVFFHVQGWLDSVYVSLVARTVSFMLLLITNNTLTRRSITQQGEPAAGVDPGIFTFVNHGTNIVALLFCIGSEHCRLTIVRVIGNRCRLQWELQCGNSVE